MRSERLSKLVANAPNRLAFWVSAVVALGVYLLSLGPSVGLEDAGELAVAADGLGVPHPPGYPLWTLLSWGFCRVFSFVTWQGLPNPAWAIALGSAVMGALATGLLAHLITQSGRTLLPKSSPAAACLAGIAGALAFAFSPVMWSQSVIVEVYALGAFFLALVMALSWQWVERPRRRTLVALGLAFGLGLTNYQVLLLALLPLGLLVLWRRWRLGLAFIALGIPLLLTCYTLMLGAMPSADAYSTPGAPVILRPEVFPARWAYALLGLAMVLLLVWGFLRKLSWKWVALPLGLALLGLILTASERSLPEGFVGTLYTFGKAWGVNLLLLAALWAICFPYRRMRRFALVATVGQLVQLLLLQQGVLLGLTSPVTGWFWWPIVWNLALLALAWRTLLQGKTVALTLLACELGLALYAYLPLASAQNPAMNWGAASTWEGFKQVLSRGQYAPIKPSDFFSQRYLEQLLDYGRDLLLQFSWPVIGLAVVGTLLLLGVLMRQRAWRKLVWLGATGLFFLVMSAWLIQLANPTGALQDGFIQKVKFISSHEIFALWIGYGLLALMTVLRLPRPAWVLAAIAPLAPLIENAANPELIRSMGAAEQTGHDFGWLFGSAMLDGSRALNAQLAPDEEPLPDPFWPPPMAQDAVFFGGTDPGRFVPTYMVFAAGLRPDIAVLTQNALADKTYVSSVRGLYGAQMWIPSEEEVRSAFLDYAYSDAAATRETVREENGRIRVTSVADVMKINASLSKALWEQNPKRSFYLEESYPIPWMAEVQRPMGLAFALDRTGNANLTEEQARNNAFWDWLSRKLIAHPGYRRDFAAQKSFSILRTQQAALYARKGLWQSAEAAYLEGWVLFPISPGVLFGYLQEILVPQMRCDVAQLWMEQYLKLDPKNTRAQTSAPMIADLAEAQTRFEALTLRVRSGEATTHEVCDLARTCEELYQARLAANYWAQVVSAPDLTAQEARDGTLALQRVRDTEHALRMLKRVPQSLYATFSAEELAASAGLAQVGGESALEAALFAVGLEAYPTSKHLWLASALASYNRQEYTKAYEAMCRAVQYGAADLIQAQPEVARIFMDLTERAKQQQKGGRP